MFSLINSKTIENKELKELVELIRKSILAEGEGVYNFKKIVSYQEFEKVICNFIKSIMKSFVEETEYKDIVCNAVVIKMPIWYEGLYIPVEGKDRVAINEKTIEHFYLGNLDALLIILHEINHFKINYAIKLGYLSEDIVRCLKEKLIRGAPNIFGEYDGNETYYNPNYEVVSKEIFVDMLAIYDIIELMKEIGRGGEYSPEEIEELLSEGFSKKLSVLKQKYDNHIRNMFFNLGFNDFYLDYEEVFDILIQDNQAWLEIPQIAIEYYLDNGKVKRKSVSQLEETLRVSTNEMEQEYLRLLIEKFNKSRMTYSCNFKKS